MQNKRTKNLKKNNTKLEKKWESERERKVLERIQNVTETCKVQIEAPAKDKQEDEDLIKLIYIYRHIPYALHSTYVYIRYICACSLRIGPICGSCTEYRLACVRARMYVCVYLYIFYSIPKNENVFLFQAFFLGFYRSGGIW